MAPRDIRFGFAGSATIDYGDDDEEKEGSEDEEDQEDQEDQEAAPVMLGHNQASDFAWSLAEVDISDIPREDMRCPHCWADFDEPDAGVDETVIKSPYGDLHMRGCLVEAITGTMGLCPVCRQDMHVDTEFEVSYVGLSDLFSEGQ